MSFCLPLTSQECYFKEIGSSWKEKKRLIKFKMPFPMVKTTFEVISSRYHTNEEYNLLCLQMILKEDLKCFVFRCSGPSMSTAHQRHPQHQHRDLWTSP